MYFYVFSTHIVRIEVFHPPMNVIVHQVFNIEYIFKSEHITQRRETMGCF